jgi:heat shock protein HslJ
MAMQIQRRSSAFGFLLLLPLLCQRSLPQSQDVHDSASSLGAAAQEAHARTAGLVVLEGTRWKLTRLKGEDLPSDMGPRAPYLMLDAKTHRVSGSSGCNRLMGSYKLDGEHLSFGPIAGTMMACVTGMDVEQRFKAVLPDVSQWRIEGQTLDMLDAEGNSLARFEATSEDDQQKQ